MKPLIFAAACLLATPGLALAHNGGLDSNGCHNNKAKNVYECHQGPLQGQTFKSKAEADARLAANKSGAQGKANTPGQQAAKSPNAPAQQTAKTPDTAGKQRGTTSTSPAAPR